MTTQEIVDQVTSQGGHYTRLTLKEAIQHEVVECDGALVRLRMGAYALREESGLELRGSGDVRRHVLEGLRALKVSGHIEVSRREIEVYLRDRGLRYAGRTVRLGLAQLLRGEDPAISRTRDWRYRLVG